MSRLLTRGWAHAVRPYLATGALLALTVGAAVAAPDASDALRCAGGIPAQSVVRDFGTGPLLPLSVISARAGVIVVVTGRNIVIVRRDGTELRMKGVLPGDPPGPEDSRKALICDGEVWVRQADLPALLGRACTCGAQIETVAQQAVTQSRGFETFAVASPTVLPPPSKPPPVRKPRLLPSLETEGEGGRSWLEVTPLETGLGFSHIAGMSEPELRGSYLETVGPGFDSRHDRRRNLDPTSPIARILSYVSVEASESGRHYQLGDSYYPLFGWATGIGFTAPVSPHADVGATVVVPEGLAGENEEGRLMLQARTPSQRPLAVEAELAGDGSYHAQTTIKRSGLNLVLSALDLGERQQRDGWWQKGIGAGFAFVGRVSSASGDYEGNAQALGMRWDAGSLHVVAERDQSAISGEEATSSSLSVSVVRRDLFAALRYIAKESGRGRSGFEWTLMRTDPAGGRQFSLSCLGPQEEGGGAYRAGATLPLGKDLRARASLEWGPAGTHPEYKVEWKRSRDQVVVFRYGMSFWDGGGQTEAQPAHALYASIAFGRTGATGDNCQVMGSVEDDAGQGVPDVVVLLDDTQEATTRADGSYQFMEVEEGAHSVKLDRGRLHADLGILDEGGEPKPRTVVAAPSAPAQADFMVIRLCRIEGRFAVTPISRDGTPGPPEAVSGAEVVCKRLGALESAVHRATTDEQGRYSFTGLRPGRYLVELTESQSFADLIAQPPSQWVFSLQAGEKVTGADFAFQRRERPVVFTEAPTPPQ